MIARAVSIVLVSAFLMVFAVSGPVICTAAENETVCKSVEELAGKIWTAHKTHNPTAILNLVDYTDADVNGTKAIHTETIDDRKTANPSSVTIHPIDQGQIDWFRIQGWRFNLDPVSLVRIEYQELFDTDVKKEVGGMLLQLPAILYYYVGVKNDRYFIATAVPIEEKTSESSDKPSHVADDDIIAAFPMETKNIIPSSPDGDTAVLVDLNKVQKTETPSEGKGEFEQKNVFLSPTFWTDATLEDVGKAIQAGVDLQARDEYGQTALILAASYNQNPDVIDLLIRHGADIHARDVDGQTALMGAATFNPNLETLDRLIKTGLDVKQKDKEGTPILILAALENSNPDVIDRLIKYGADIRERDMDGWTPLIAAAIRNQNPEMIDRLMKYGVDINARCEDGMTALAKAASLNENPEVLERLIKHGADIRARDNDGHSVLFWAEQNRYIRGTDIYWKLRKALSQQGL